MIKAYMSQRGDSVNFRKEGVFNIAIAKKNTGEMYWYFNTGCLAESEPMEREEISRFLKLKVIKALENDGYLELPTPNAMIKINYRDIVEMGIAIEQ